MGNEISRKRQDCIKLFEASQLRADQIIFILNINDLKNMEVPIDNSRFPHLKKRSDYIKEVIRYIKTCDDSTLNNIINYLNNLNSENDITGSSIHI